MVNGINFMWVESPYKSSGVSADDNSYHRTTSGHDGTKMKSLWCEINKPGSDCHMFCSTLKFELFLKELDNEIEELENHNDTWDGSKRIAYISCNWRCWKYILHHFSTWELWRRIMKPKTSNGVWHQRMGADNWMLADRKWGTRCSKAVWLSDIWICLDNAFILG